MTIVIDVSEEASRRVQRRAAEAGFGTAADYVRSLIEADVPTPGPDVGLVSDAELDRVLAKRADSGLEVEVTEDRVASLRERARQAIAAGRG